MTLTMTCTIEGGVKNSPLSCARCLEKLREDYIFVDASEDIARGRLDLLGVEGAHQVFQHGRIVEDAVVLWEHIAEWLE